MPENLYLSDEAASDLEEIWIYIAPDSIRNADGFIDQLCKKCIEIADLKSIGRRRDELFPGLLSLAYKRYVIFSYALMIGSKSLGFCPAVEIFPDTSKTK